MQKRIKTIKELKELVAQLNKLLIELISLNCLKTMSNIFRSIENRLDNGVKW